MPSDVRAGDVGVPYAVLRPRVALVRDLYLRAQHIHAEPLRNRLRKIARNLQEESLRRRDHEKAGKKPSLG